MIVDWEREIENFVPETYWMLSLETEKDGVTIGRGTTGRFTDHETALAAEGRKAARRHGGKRGTEGVTGRRRRRHHDLHRRAAWALGGERDADRRDLYDERHISYQDRQHGLPGSAEPERDLEHLKEGLR